MAEQTTKIDELELDLEAPFSTYAVPSPVYHYTPAAGLMGILESNEFWASAIGFSNDASEGKYSTRIGLEVLHSHPIWQQPTDPCKTVVAFLNLLFQFPGRDWEDGFIACFCEKDDVLSQWETYGDAASFSIGFRALSTDNLGCEGSSGMRISKVEYDESKQRSSLHKILDAAHEQLTMNPSEQDRVLRFLNLHVTEWACFVKHKAFHEEREWRITVFPSFGGLRNPGAAFPGNVPRLASHMKLRERRGRLLPYLIIKPKASRFDIQSVTVGPSKTQALDAKAVELLKEKLGLGHVEVVLSDIPLQS